MKVLSSILWNCVMEVICGFWIDGEIDVAVLKRRSQDQMTSSAVSGLPCSLTASARWKVMTLLSLLTVQLLARYGPD